MTLPASLVDDLRLYVEALGRHFGERLVSVVVFGSQARGEARPESDLDVLIVVRARRLTLVTLAYSGRPN